MLKLAIALILIGCAATPRPFALRAPYTRDTDLDPVSVACRPDPSDQTRLRCAPAPYVSPFIWDQLENSMFGPASRALAVEVTGEAANANSLDEVADSAWFENRIGAVAMSPAELALGGCAKADVLPVSAQVADGAWIIDHGKDNGSSLGFRIEVPGKGRYMLKADEADAPEQASAAAVIGQALYHAVGFHTPCEQVVYLRRSQLTLRPGLTRVDNQGFTQPFDDRALDAVLASSARRDGLVRMTASKWLPGLTLGPFRYRGTRADDPNDVIDHERRRELRGSRVMAAWLNHWDSREQNSMDVWLAVDPTQVRSSPGVVRHYLMDTSDVIGQAPARFALASRMGHSYYVDVGTIVADFLSFGTIDRPWDHAAVVPGREKFGFFSARDFDPDAWRGSYANPAFVQMTERDAAWMARILARFTRADVLAIARAAQLFTPGDAEFITDTLLARRRVILQRYLTRLSPLTDARVEAGQLCVTDLARANHLAAPSRFHYTAVERAAGRAIPLTITRSRDRVCVTPVPQALTGPDDAPARRVTIELRNGLAGPLELHAYDLGARGLRLVGVQRP